MREVMESFRGKISVPCFRNSLTEMWEEQGLIEKLRSRSEGEGIKLPPQHLEKGADGLIEDLEELGIFQILSDGRIQMPDVYRIAFGLGRRGGVKPLK